MINRNTIIASATDTGGSIIISHSLLLEIKMFYSLIVYNVA